MVFAASAALALRNAQALRPGEELTLLRPAHEGREAARHGATELASQLEAQVTEISGRFDRRNGTDRVGTQMRAILQAEPLIDHLPLSPTSTRPTPRLDPLPGEPTSVDSSTVVTGSDAGSASIVDVFAKTGGPGLGAGGPAPAPVRRLDLDQAMELAQTDRAAEAIDALVEAVADRTAHGDQVGAADARHYLAIAYLNIDRPLDAAEVAEEALAYRLRVDAARDEAEPASANEVHHLLAAIYQRLGQPDEAITHLDAIAADCARRDDHRGVARMSEGAGDILDAVDRDDEAARRFHAAARAFARAGLTRDQVRNHRQRALSATWAHGPEAGLAALNEARASAALLPDDDASRGDRAFVDIDEAQIRWRMDDLTRAADLARQAADAWQAIGELRSASEARVVLARILIDAERFADAEGAIRQALRDLPEPDRRSAFVEVLATALRAQDRSTDADAVWAEFDLTRPDDTDQDED
jgi:tetratricopeptide (TPR) repeat protein